MNEYFTLMTAARTEGKKSFKYKGTTYTAGKTKTGLTVYRKSGGGKKKEETAASVGTDMKEHAKHHSKAHIKQMKKDIKGGMSFADAHKAAQNL
tara:strand:- start:986 stop:1267 length:282 start_codon:yes stop_codon:yes gene_type:complete